MCNIHPMHARFVLILNHKDTITAGCFPSPQWAGSNMFLSHPIRHQENYTLLNFT